MIVVKVELWPLGDESQAECLGTLEIANTGEGEFDIGNYIGSTCNCVGKVLINQNEAADARINKWGGGRKKWKGAVVEGFPRQALGPWDLLFRILRVMVGDRN